MLKVVTACDAEGVRHWGCHHSLVQRVELQLRVGRCKTQMKYQVVPLEKEIFKAQVSPLKTTLLQISGRFGSERSQREKGRLEEPRSSSLALVLWFWV